METQALTTVTLATIATSPEQWAARRAAFNDWVNTQLKAGVDYGHIPGTDKPTLLKPGAEKIAQLFGCCAIAEITRRDQDPDTGYLYLETTVRLVHSESGIVAAIGVGSCCSYESRYRWRWQYSDDRPDDTDPREWERYYRKWRLRVPNRDLIDTWNTVLKIAKKRALVDAALSLSGASERFTQDIEDLAPEPPPKRTPALAKHWTANPKAVDRFWTWVTDSLGLSAAEALKALAVAELADFTGTMAEAKAILETYVPTNTN